MPGPPPLIITDMVLSLKQIMKIGKSPVPLDLTAEMLKDSPD